ncbi:MAG: low affinity iron permease family protein [Arenimonas sp.]
MSQVSLFTRLAKAASRFTGRAISFNLAVLVIALWLITGPIFAYSDTWQLVINTATTIITFLMVFLIQNTQNRDTAAIQIKLDELIRSTQGAHNALLDLEELDEKTLEAFREQYECLAAKSRTQIAAGGNDNGSPDLDAPK